MAKKAPYGTWSSPITADAITQGSKPINELLVDPKTHRVYHIETRPAEGGRSAIVESQTTRDIVGKEWNVRTGVQEYGGGAAIVNDGVVYFSHYGDGRVYKVNADSKTATPEPVTPDSKALHRFADFTIHPILSEILVAVMEDHTDDPDGTAPSKVITTLCTINTVTKTVHQLVSGADFYASPRFSPDGTRLVWLQWFHPDMPWEGSELKHANVTINNEKVDLSNVIKIAGQPAQLSVAFPSWISNDILLFTSDQTGYQNLWKFTDGKASPVLSKAIAEDFSEPAWILGWSPYAPVDNTGNFVLCTAFKDGQNILYLVDVKTGAPPKQVKSPFVAIDVMRVAAAGSPEVVFYSPTIDKETSIMLCTLSSSSSPDDPLFTPITPVLTESIGFPSSLFSKPKPFTLGSADQPLYVVFYPPTNPEYAGSSIPGEKPPCVVNVHGGPTALEPQGLNLKKQYFTSRGWAWLDINYGGSSGYGRDYIERLKGKWGIVDVEDCIRAVDILSKEPYNLIDIKRAAIRGGSAGGYTTLAALSISSNPGAFAAGTSSYGVSDLAKLDEFTHKFESHYADRLVGGTPAENPQLFKERSPIFHADKIVSPLLILQGELDRVVPKEQAEAMRDTIEKNGGVVEYKLYKGEGHGWRQDANIKDALERELDFYERQFKLK